MKISVSLLSTYLYCPRKLFLQRVLKLEEPPKESIVLGTIRHEIYDMINKNEQMIVLSINENQDYDDIKEKYKMNYLRKAREIIIKNKSSIMEVNLNPVQVFKRTWPYIISEAEERAKNVHKFLQEHNIYGKELWEKLIPKIISELKIESDSLRLKGIIDRVEIYPDGYVPIELKTGKMPREGVWPGHKIQIAAYALLLEEKYHTRIKEGFVNYLDTKTPRQITINPFMKVEIAGLVREIQELLKKRRLPNYVQNKNKCTNCGLREKCYNEEEMRVSVLEIR